LLEDGGDDDDARPLGPREENAGVARPELCAARGDLAHGVSERAAVGCEGGADLHIEPGIPVVALPERGIVAGELELVVPLKLQDDAVRGACVGGKRQGEQEGEGAQPRTPHPPPDDSRRLPRHAAFMRWGAAGG
jgi:hypothetical protein